MKKITALLVCFIVLFSLCACEDKVNTQNNKNINVTFELDSNKSNNETVYVATSLPVGMKLEVEIKQGNYDSVETVEVQGDINGNYIETEPQRDENEKPIKEGNYILKITSPEYYEQSADIINQIGEKGEKLVGTSVFSDEETKEKFINYSKPLKLKDHIFSINEN